MADGIIATNPKQAFQDNDGGPASGYLLHTYLTGSSTPATTWQDQARLTANTNPIVLDARGECLLWLEQEVEYRFILTTPTGTVIWTVDDISGAQSVPVEFPPALANPAGHSSALVTDGTIIQWLDSSLEYRNRIINSNFRINQRGVSGTVVLAAGIYGLDRWKGGGTGCTFTFGIAAGMVTVTITAGSLAQVIENFHVPFGTNTCTLSWTGTALGRINTGAYGPSPRTASVVGDTNVTVEFSTGTLARPQFEVGNIATPHMYRLHSLEELACKRYYNMFGGLVVNDIALLGSSSGAGVVYSGNIQFPVQMRAIPTISSPAAWTAVNCSQPVLYAIGTNGFSWYITATAAGVFTSATTAGFTGGHWNVNAEIP